MEDVVRRELEQQESELNSKTNSDSWLRFLGLQGSSLEEKYQQQCVKELEKIIVSRRQLERTAKSNPTVRILPGCFSRSACDRCLFSSLQLRSVLDYDELTTVKKNLQAQTIDVSNDFVREPCVSIARAPHRCLRSRSATRGSVSIEFTFSDEIYPPVGTADASSTTTRKARPSKAYV